MALSVVGWQQIGDGLLFEPAQGHKATAVQILIRNEGSSAISIASLAQSALKDADFRRYGADLLATVAAGGGIDGELGASDAVHGKIGFTVPIDAEGLIFTFDARLFGGGKAFVELGEEPVSIPPTDR